MPTYIPYYGTPYTEGVKMIKISKVDNDGVDRTNELAQLQSITVSPTNGQSITYIIASVQENLNYFLYLVATNPADVNSGFNPFVFFSPGIANFVSSDYDVTYGNIDFPQFSTRLMDVNYGWIGGINTPLNFGLIISGTADRAQVQDSSYSSRAWSNIRYNGSRVSSQDFNKPF
jgi:hypothetical protein